MNVYFYSYFQVKCLDAFTGQQTRLVVVVDALDSCEQDRVLIVLNAIHTLCSDQHSPFVIILAIDPHIISKVCIRVPTEYLLQNTYHYYIYYIVLAMSYGFYFLAGCVGTGQLSAGTW